MMLYILTMQSPRKVIKEYKSSNPAYLLGLISSLVREKWQVLDVHCEWLVSLDEVSRKAS